MRKTRSNDVPSADLFGRVRTGGALLFISPGRYSSADGRRTIARAGRVIKPRTYSTMFGLIAATGMRVSEALAIRLGDVTDDGLIIAQTKFKKSRLLPLHATTRQALDCYLQNAWWCRPRATRFSFRTRGRLQLIRQLSVFLQVARAIGLRGGRDREEQGSTTSVIPSRSAPSNIARMMDKRLLAISPPSAPISGMPMSPTPTGICKRRPS